MKKRIKQLLKILDSNVFNGYLRKIYEKLKENQKKQFFHGKKSVVIEQSVPDLVLMQYNINEYMEYQFFDLGVRYLAIANYYKKNRVGYYLYKKMHTNGGNYGNNNKTEEYYKRMQKKKKTATYGNIREEHSIEQFEKLIQSYDEKGYDKSSIIMCDRNLLNMNGSHRLSLAIYRNQEFINVDVHDIQFKRRFNIDWFWRNDFTNKELELIKDTTNLIIQQSHRAIGEFYCILYPPAEPYFDEIIADINLMDKDNIRVTGYKDYKVVTQQFANYLQAIYSFDSILKRNLERKIDYILSTSNIVDNKVHYRTLSLEVKNPLYRLKYDNGKPESYAIVKLKENIRTRYKNRNPQLNIHRKGDYNHDVIIHSTDNYLSNKAFRLIEVVDYDLTVLFNALKEIKYAVIESGIEKLSNEFPKKFYLTEDIDILIDTTDLEKAITITLLFCEKHFVGEWYYIDEIRSENGKRVRVWLKDCMIVMFDFMDKMTGLTEVFCKKALSNAQNSAMGYKYLMIENELTFRTAKYIENPEKKWHLDFLKQNKDKIKLVEEDFKDFNAAKRLELGINE